MKDRSGDDFADVITGLTFNNPDIVSAPKKFDNSAGVYHNPNSKEGFQYAAAFLTLDDNSGCAWIETYGVEKEGTKMVLRGRWGSRCLGKDPTDSVIDLEAAEIIEGNLQPL